MRLDQELVLRKLCESRQEAQECIEKGYVLVDGVVVTKRTRIVSPDSKIEVTTLRKFVSRGGEKLEGAISHIYHNAQPDLFSSKRALDVGSSTGGFTDCLLAYGIASVTAIDVGTSQLHQSLRNNAKVTLHENTDIRKYSSGILFDVVVADVSFIALEKIIETIISFGHQDSEFFLLIKPQFEVGFGNTKKGIVKDKNLVEKILNKYKENLKLRHAKDIHIFPCVLQGGDGNQEYFLYFKK
jgi:23S rRNA (cytidine1920-2'-O)/16S rRNA (cytidine1409-2'-O)-methyltransferase